MTMRNLVHCALSLAIAFAGFAALYLQLGAPFAGWAQVIVYIGAIAILIVFAILLTRSDSVGEKSVFSKSWAIGSVICLAVFGMLTLAILKSDLTGSHVSTKPEPTVKEIGNDLMTRYVLPLEAIAILLTAAAIGAVIIALKENSPGKEESDVTKLEAVEPLKTEPSENHHH